MTEPLEPLEPLLHQDPTPGGADDAAALPGHDQPAWLWPVLVVAFSTLIAWLAIFGPAPTDSIADTATAPTDASTVATDASDDGTEQAGAPGGESADASSDQPAATEAAGGGAEAVDVEVEAGVVDPIGDAEDAEIDAAPVVEATDLDLPEPGFVRLDGVVHPLVRSCVAVAPLAPASTSDILSTHLLGAAGDAEPIVPVVERWFTAAGADGVRIDGLASGDEVATGDVVADVTDGPNGSFAGQIELADGTAFELALNPPPEGDERLACADAVVTNEPAQFAFPYTRPVLAVCRDGDPATDGGVEAVLIEGARMLATANPDGSHTLRLVAPATPLTEALDLVDEAGELFVDGDRLGYSGLVTDGTVSRDLTFDVDTAGAPTCP